MSSSSSSREYPAQEVAQSPRRGSASSLDELGHHAGRASAEWSPRPAARRSASAACACNILDAQHREDVVNVHAAV